MKDGKSFKGLLSCSVFRFPFKLSHIKGPQKVSLSLSFFFLQKVSELYAVEKPVCREQMDFSGKTFQRQCVGLRQAVLNNLNLLRKNSQLCPLSSNAKCYRTTAGC